MDAQLDSLPGGRFTDRVSTYIRRISARLTSESPYLYVPLGSWSEYVCQTRILHKESVLCIVHHTLTSYWLLLTLSWLCELSAQYISRWRFGSRRAVVGVWVLCGSTFAKLFEMFNSRIGARWIKQFSVCKYLSTSDRFRKCDRNFEIAEWSMSLSVLPSAYALI